MESVWMYGLDSERYRTLPARGSSTSIFCSDTGGRAILREGLARLGGGGGDLGGMVNPKTHVRPAQPVPGQLFVEEGALQEEGDHAGAEVLTELGQMDGSHMDGPSASVESVFAENGAYGIGSCMQV
jgi:hypothetical protein